MTAIFETSRNAIRQEQLDWRHIWRTAVKSQLQVYCLSGIIETSTGSKFKIEPAVVLDFIFLAWETKFLHQILYLGM